MDDFSYLTPEERCVDRRERAKTTAIPVKYIDMDFSEVEARVLANMVQKTNEVTEFAFGKREVSGSVTCYFTNPSLLYAVSEAAEQYRGSIIRLADEIARIGLINRKQRKLWRKRRKALAATDRRERARAIRRAEGRKTY